MCCLLFVVVRCFGGLELVVCCVLFVDCGLICVRSWYVICCIFLKKNVVYCLRGVVFLLDVLP